MIPLAAFSPPSRPVRRWSPVLRWRLSAACFLLGMGSMFAQAAWDPARPPASREESDGDAETSKATPEVAPPASEPAASAGEQSPQIPDDLLPAEQSEFQLRLPPPRPTTPADPQLLREFDAQLRRVWDDPDAEINTGDPVVDGILRRAREAARAGTAPSNPTPQPQPSSGGVPATHRPAAERAYRAAEQLLRTARLLARLPADAPVATQRQSLVTRMREEAYQILRARHAAAPESASPRPTPADRPPFR